MCWEGSWFSLLWGAGLQQGAEPLSDVGLYSSPALPLPETHVRQLWASPELLEGLLGDSLHRALCSPQLRRASCPAWLDLENVCSWVSPLCDKSLNLHFHMCESRAREDPAESLGLGVFELPIPAMGLKFWRISLAPTVLWCLAGAGWVLCSEQGWC